ncbi:MAG: undecaprenyldiphospho-muramoylpentapeptide beta-N-acetylglucosaminyltransferase [Sporomusaceae bacterium]|jgi:UDP-N-acetylglucosamine--N-acetylmuramyl-(pentapeptide) pyrophosphoryl-undecaprenol N-acetylglucosamine transferase|nr:undecaprenyldiphospho-muramoylpentapeptide beta-N-acetylglucosaminyltransferase [Sporomusaceae bacterium]
MKLVVSGGGTGGHIYPAATIAREVLKLREGCEILFVGTPDGLEADVIPRLGFEFRTIRVSGFKRKFTLENIRTVGQASFSIYSSWKILKEFQPDVVVGTGGFVCGPVLAAAALLKIPSLIQEQNAVPGVTNRILGRFATKIALGYEEAVHYFAAQRKKVVVTGNPIREEILAAQREEALAKLELAPDKLTILVSGGSRGARSINNAMVEIYQKKYFVEKENVQVLHLTGKSGYNEVVGNIKQISIEPKHLGNITIKPYLYNMPDALAAADLAVFRAGAIGLAELTAKGIPSILVPYPYAAANHQEFNAKALEKYGAAVVIKDAYLNGQTLLKVIDELIHNADNLKRMSRKSQELARPQAAAHIAQLVVSLSNNKE